MKAATHSGETRSEHKRASTLPSPGGGKVRTSRDKHYLVWGMFRLVLGVIQMTFAAAALLHLIFTGLSPATLIYTAVATIATLVSRVLFGGRRGPHCDSHQPACRSMGGHLRACGTQ